MKPIGCLFIFISTLITAATASSQEMSQAGLALNNSCQTAVNNSATLCQNTYRIDDGYNFTACRGFAPNEKLIIRFSHHGIFGAGPCWVCSIFILRQSEGAPANLRGLSLSEYGTKVFITNNKWKIVGPSGAVLQIENPNGVTLDMNSLRLGANEFILNGQKLESPLLTDPIDRFIMGLPYTNDYLLDPRDSQEQK